MYVIIVYDIKEERVNKVRVFLKRYLNWIQNSAFEGELSEGKFEEMKVGLRKIIDKDADSILIYSVSAKKWVNKEVIGIEKSEITTII